MSEKLRALGDKIIVRAADIEAVTKGGIIIPDTAKAKPVRGTVVTAGPGKADELMELKEGDTVVYAKYAGTEITIGEENLLIMRQSDVLAVVETEPSSAE